MECKDGECRVDIPDLSVEDDTEKKVDKKDSSKRLSLLLHVLSNFINCEGLFFASSNSSTSNSAK